MTLQEGISADWQKSLAQSADSVKELKDNLDGLIFLGVIILVLVVYNLITKKGGEKLMKKCKSCQTEIDTKATKCPHCQADQRGWFRRHPILTGILGLVLFFIIVGAIGGSGSKNTTPASNTTPNANNANSQPTATSISKEPDVPTEYKSALNKATTYANTMNMSKKGVYDQLVSNYGEKFTPEAAQYAIDNVKADWNANALAKAKTYQDTLNMSPAAIRSQLISANGEKFTEAEADYAIQHLNDKSQP